MKILVLLAQVPDTTSRIAFKDGGTAFDGNGVTWIVNPYDEWYALVRALELKEAAGAGSVTTITVGGADTEATIRKGLAIGARGRPTRRCLQGGGPDCGVREGQGL